jgi:hypothetical protein
MKEGATLLLQKYNLMMEGIHMFQRLMAQCLEARSKLAQAQPQGQEISLH